MQEVSGSIPLSSTKIETLAEKRGFFVYTSCLILWFLRVDCQITDIKKPGKSPGLITTMLSWSYSTSAAIDADRTLTSVEP